MNRTSYTILRVGIGITFLWIGVLILRDPMGWSQFIQPWAAKLIPGSIIQTMQETAGLDILVGFLLIIGFWTWLAALLGALHLITVLVTCGITDVTCRDIGLFAATFAILVDSKPFKWVPSWVPGKRG